MRIPVANFDVTGDVRPVDGAVPSAYALNQNYLNPFNPTTNISYAVPVRSNVKLVVYDVTGREVATLVNGFQEAGSYVADFSAKNLSSGVYFFSLTAGNFSSVKKMALMK